VKNPPIDAVESMRRLTITVTITRANELKARIWIAKRLLALAAWVANCNLEITGPR